MTQLQPFCVDICAICASLTLGNMICILWLTLLLLTVEGRALLSQQPAGPSDAPSSNATILEAFKGDDFASDEQLQQALPPGSCSKHQHRCDLPIPACRGGPRA